MVLNKGNGSESYDSFSVVDSATASDQAVYTNSLTFDNQQDINGTLGAITLSAKYQATDGFYQGTHIDIGSGNTWIGASNSDSSTQAMIRIESRDSSNNFKPTIYFRDATANGGQPFKLDEIALKSDLSSINLADYQGDWNLSVNKQYYSTPLTYSFSSTKTIASGEGSDISEPILLLDATLSVDDLSATGGLCINGYLPVLYMTSGVSYLDILNGAVPENTDYNFAYCAPHILGEEYVDSAGNKTSGKIEVSNKNIGLSVSENTSTKLSLLIRNEGTGNTGIYIKDTTIQEDEFTLKSLVDRIAALETQVSELQTQLAAKANTNSPTFTGKVTINSITE